jgi:hypothetical protein
MLKHPFIVACAFGLVVGCSSSPGADDSVATAHVDTAAVTTAQETTTEAKRCKGALPMLCELCSDGSSACAHWTVVHGKCEVETCPTAPAPTCPGLEHACTCVGGAGYYCLAAGAMCVTPTSPCP